MAGKPYWALRTIAEPWGTKWALRSPTSKERVLKGSRLALAGLHLASEAAKRGLTVSLEHPAVPNGTSSSPSSSAVTGQALPSLWRVSEVIDFLRESGLSSTTANVSPTVGGTPMNMTFALTQPLAGLSEGMDADSTAQALGSAIAQLLALKPPTGGERSTDPALLDDLVHTARRDLESLYQTKVRVPPVAPCWDPLDRWHEVFRTRWKMAAHNNILEMEAALLSLRHSVRTLHGWGEKLLLVSDSQVVIGALMKGRSGARAVLRGCRRAAGIRLGFGVSLYCRYVKTHRNHADGPSRGGPIGVFQKDEREVEPIRSGPWYKDGDL